MLDFSKKHSKIRIRLDFLALIVAEWFLVKQNGSNVASFAYIPPNPYDYDFIPQPIKFIIYMYIHASPFWATIPNLF